MLGTASGGFSIVGTADDHGGKLRRLELLTEGLTYDLEGPAPGAPCATPLALHRIALGPDFSEIGLEAITLRPGPHLAGGGAMLPVVRGLAGLTAQLAGLPGSVAVAWHPARCVSEAASFGQSVSRWCEGGPFPGLGLTALAVEHDGALRSEGLALIVGQELRIEPELMADQAAASSLALDLLQHLATKGRLETAERFVTADGLAVRIEPSANRRFVRVWQAR